MNYIKKHAYLIMAHSDFFILEKLISLIDHERNDIYIHIDKKVKNFDFEHYLNLVKKSKIYFTDRIDVRWGHYSLVETEMILLKESAKKKYYFYHLLSGVDLPLKTQKEIHNFFDKYPNKQFIHFGTEFQCEQRKYCIEYYHFNKYIRTNSHSKFQSLYNHFNYNFKKLQSKLNIKRYWDKGIELKFGTNWFSINHELAEYIISNHKWINKTFKHTHCSDELFLQTLVYNSPFKEQVYKLELNDDLSNCLRYIDWDRGNPYTFRSSDFESFLMRNEFFARKFSSSIDEEIINKLYNYLKECE